MSALDNLIRVARALAPIRDQRFVFAGASVLPLLLDDPGGPPARSTVDVDAIVDVISYAGWDTLRRRLASCGLHVRADQLVGKARICLFDYEGLEVDIMPVRLREILPPSRMLELGFAYAELHRLDGLEIFALSAPALLAAKLEAFFERGLRDLFVSKDLEDIVALLDGRVRLIKEVESAPPEVRFFIAAQMARLLGNGQVLDTISDLMRNTNRERRLLELARQLMKQK